MARGWSGGEQWHGGRTELRTRQVGRWSSGKAGTPEEADVGVQETCGEASTGGGCEPGGLGLQLGDQD